MMETISVKILSDASADDIKRIFMPHANTSDFRNLRYVAVDDMVYYGNKDVSLRKFETTIKKLASIANIEYELSYKDFIIDLNVLKRLAAFDSNIKESSDIRKYFEDAMRYFKNSSARDLDDYDYEYVLGEEYLLLYKYKGEVFVGYAVGNSYNEYYGDEVTDSGVNIYIANAISVKALFNELEKFESNVINELNLKKLSSLSKRVHLFADDVQILGDIWIFEEPYDDLIDDSETIENTDPEDLVVYIASHVF